MKRRDHPGLSIRTKLLILLTVLPLVSLGLYLVMATRLFEKDKVAYVFDSSVAVSRSLAVQTRLEIEGLVSRIKPILENFDPERQEFSQIAKDTFEKQQDVSNLLMLMQNPDGSFRYASQLQHVNGQARALTANQMRAVVEALANGVSLQTAGQPGEFMLAQRLGEKGAPRTVIQVSFYKSNEFADTFMDAALHKSFLLNSRGEVIIGAMGMEDSLFKDRSSSDIFSTALSSPTPEGTGEVPLSDKQSILMSYSKLPIGGFIVTSVMDKKAALRAVETLVTKSMVFFVALLASTMLISLIASVQLTSTLRQLFEATQRVAQGHFDIQIKARSGDEIGGLANSFNLMAKEVSRLMSETAEKARMANELATVRTVQETLFPESKKDFGKFEICGHFEPASECGGDWWNYCLIDGKLFCWIGDATGHGAPAALITGAARSASAIIEMIPDMTPAKALQVMNRAIGETSKGKIMMTFFICMIDLETGKLTYSSASHDPPYLLRLPAGKKPTKKDLEPLMEGSGPRLGDNPNAVYEDVHVQLAPGDMVLFYTDGIVDLKSPSGETWGERNFIKSLLSCSQSAESAELRMEHIKSQIRDYRKDASLIDDITLVLCQYKKLSEMAA